MILKIY